MKSAIWQCDDIFSRNSWLPRIGGGVKLSTDHFPRITGTRSTFHGHEIPGPTQVSCNQKNFSWLATLLIPPLFPRCLLFTLRALGIASSSPKKRCRRGRKSVRRGFTVKKFLHCALLNVRSPQPNLSTLQHHTVVHILDPWGHLHHWLLASWRQRWWYSFLLIKD
jgi:hypothetical protein